MSQREKRESLELSVWIAAKPETIFPLLSTAEGVSQWLSASAQFEPKKGSAFSVDFSNFQTLVRGEVLEIVPNERVVFSWGVAEGAQKESMPPGSTTVTISLEPEATGGTRVLLRHSGLPSVPEREAHRAGWKHYLSQISLHGNRAQLGERVPESVENFLAAWNEGDFGKRLRLLERCCPEDVAYHDDYAIVQDRQGLCDQIENARRFLPDVRLELAGGVRLSHHHARFLWRMVKPNGEPAASGASFADADADGRLARIVGFWDEPARS